MVHEARSNHLPTGGEAMIMPTKAQEHRQAYAMQAEQWLREFERAHGKAWVRLQMDGISAAIASYAAEIDGPRESYYRLQKAADMAARPILRRGE